LPRSTAAPSDKRLRYRVVAIDDRSALRSACRHLSRVSRTEGGTYVVVEAEGKAPRRVARDLLTGEHAALYVGGSSKLRRRVVQMLCTLSGRNRRHRFAALLRDGYWGSRRLEDLLLVLLPFSPAACLEDFLVRAYAAHHGSRPIGNERWVGSTSAHNEEPWIDVSWPLLFQGRIGE